MTTSVTFTMRELLEAGVHFGHHTRRWNPKMKKYIFGARNNIHIINLEETVPMLYQALDVISSTVAKGGRVLFVGTKRQAQDRVAEVAHRSGQYYVNHRWLGGMMTNWATISKSIKRLKELEKDLERTDLAYTKRELLTLNREKNKLERALGGIKDMGGRPDVVIVFDTNREGIAINEANKLGIPIIAIVDTNSDPDKITYPIPGNDDALRAIDLYCDLFAQAVLEGIENWKAGAGIDAGAEAAPVAEVVPVVEEAAVAEVEVKTEAKPAVKAKKVPAKKVAAKKVAAKKEEKVEEKTEAKAEEKKPVKKAAAKKAPAKKAPAKKAPAKKAAAKKAPVKKAAAKKTDAEEKAPAKKAPAKKATAKKAETKAKETEKAAEEA